MVYAEADRVRKEYDESSSKLKKIQSRVSSLEKKLKQDFGLYDKNILSHYLRFTFFELVLSIFFLITGPEKEFYSFHGRCFESKQGK